ncbi:hypothetical protein CS022_23285 [Veronia nyctiphanis]|uniref:Uncharacterized protein n=1 Tax=Veronia nyctiphanis TaxID=1278244 RepID=A0A4Q0YJ15_9GAMM|nr:hypothetical protein [Veronia nyctiphanis]RXJ70403.1 hypothetical protein CS022_23285 [Veronia nyctiphanis]
MIISTIVCGLAACVAAAAPAVATGVAVGAGAALGVCAVKALKPVVGGVIDLAKKAIGGLLGAIFGGGNKPEPEKPPCGCPSGYARKQHCHSHSYG